MMIRDLCFERAIWAFGTESFAIGTE